MLGSPQRAADAPGPRHTMILPLRPTSAAALALLLLAACQTQAPSQTPPQTVMSADEAEARQVCNDETAADVRYAGSEAAYEGCVAQFLYKRRRGWR